MTVIFKIKLTEKTAEGRLFYIIDDNSFNFSPYSGADIDLMLGNLCFGFNSISKELNTIWGYNPKGSWIEKSFELPESKTGTLVLSTELEPGLAYELEEKVSSYYNKKTGWLWIQSTGTNGYTSAVKFTENIILLINGVSLVGCIVRPEFIQSSLKTY